MKKETENNSFDEKADRDPKNDNFLPLSIVTAAIILVGAWIYTTGPKALNNSGWGGALQENNAVAGLEKDVLPQNGIVLPIQWKDLGAQMVKSGVIDLKKFESIYLGRGGLNDDEKKLLLGESNGNITMNVKNSGFLLNMFWAFGLGNKNEILENGPMTTYDGKKADSPAEALAKAGRFASTGGWSLSDGNVMNHYSRHSFVVLSADQQKLVERVSKGIYRPCCGNSVYFPDCNHGMAMLGLLELLAANGVNENDMYKIALRVNSYWFPDTYLAIAQYFQKQGTSWNRVDPKEVLGVDYSSAAGYERVLKEVAPVETNGGGGCSV